MTTVAAFRGEDGLLWWDCPECGKTHKAPECCKDGTITGCETKPKNVRLVVKEENNQ